MHKNPHELATELDLLEKIEKSALRLLVQALYDFREDATEIFRNESDHAADIGEDITEEAIGALSLSKIHQRLYGKVDFKKACYLFFPEFSIRIALFVDSKAEKNAQVARLQMSQLSMTVKQMRSGEAITKPGLLPQVLTRDSNDYLTVTMLVKYVYSVENNVNTLEKIVIAAVPNGMLQDRYNPTHTDTIFVAGPDAPSRKEEFRTRLSFAKLKAKARWRVQEIFPGKKDFIWSE